jgi:hypothetical protein
MKVKDLPSAASLTFEGASDNGIAFTRKMRVVSLLAHSPIAKCATRDRFVSAYRRSLTEYHHTLAGLLDTRTVDEAAEETNGLYGACMNARAALQEHERAHGCHGDD